MRLAKHLAHAGVASRRKAEVIVADGRVTVGGQVVRDPARDVDDDSDVRLDGRPVRVGTQARVVYAVHKPGGVVSTASDPGGRPTVVELVDSRERLYPVGRLDSDATGLILLTNDGPLAHSLTHPSFEVPKTYRVHIRNPPMHEPAMAKLRDGVDLDDGRTAPAKVRKVSSRVIDLSIHEGRNRQVKRMCEAVGHPVISLQRIAFGPLRLGALAEGGHRLLSDAEVERLREAAR